jgi:hypothetical protein
LQSTRNSNLDVLSPICCYELTLALCGMITFFWGEEGLLCLLHLQMDQWLYLRSCSCIKCISYYSCWLGFQLWLSEKEGMLLIHGV